MKKSVKIPAVLGISFILILLQTVGAFYSKSFALFSYGGLIIANSFSLLLKFASSNETDESLKNLKKAQFISIILNSLTLFILTLIIISKAFVAAGVSPPKIINIPVAQITTLLVFIGLVLCFFIDRRFIFTALLSFLITLGFSIPIFKRITLLDYYLSIFFATLIMIQAVLLIKNSLEMLKNKQGGPVLSIKKLQ
jgi:Co/Zn/Cd efflux system component